MTRRLGMSPEGNRSFLHWGSARRLISRVFVYVVFTTACISVIVGCSASGTKSQPSLSLQMLTLRKLIGFSVPEFPRSLPTFDDLAKAAQLDANVSTWYQSLGVPFDAAKVAKISRQGIFPIIEIDSDSTPLAAIAKGGWDEFFGSYARAVAEYGSPVGIDFDHEFNGLWSQWGPERNTAKSFVAAWRRIVTIFRRNGATNVVWIWNPNVIAPNTVSMKPWYPGGKYVTWIGVDGYFFHKEDTFGTVFGRTLRELNTFTDKRVLIVETGALPGAQRVGQINSLFNGLESNPKVVGFIWFDYDKGTGHDWRLQGDAPALKALHSGAVAYRKPG